jgi:alkylation response protein AidB-like acyl-CoA dehydrogenase
MTVSDGSDLTGDQRALRDTLLGVLVAELPTAALRAALETDVGYSPQLHTRLAAELGLAGLTIPGEFGGLGLSQAEACVVHTELGRALYPGPYLAGYLAAGVLAATVGYRRPRDRRTLAAAASRRIGDRDDRGRRFRRPLVIGNG